MKAWNITELNGYQPMTTFWQDFSIAEMFSIDAVKETFIRVFEEWKKDYKYLTELVLVLNHKIWQWYSSDSELALVYNELWSKADEYAYDNLKDEEFGYFWMWTD